MVDACVKNRQGLKKMKRGSFQDYPKDPVGVELLTAL